MAMVGTKYCLKTVLVIVGTSSYNIVAMASDYGGSACDFYSFQVR